MNNFLDNEPLELKNKWSFDRTNLKNYKKVLIVGCGQTGYMVNCLANSLSPYFLNIRQIHSVSGTAINTLGKHTMYTFNYNIRVRITFICIRLLSENRFPTTFNNQFALE